MSIEIRALGPGDDDAVLAAAALYHLLVAYEEDNEPVGFVSGIETTHPDKGTEMFLYELSVASHARLRRTGTALVTALEERARQNQCTGMWVAVDADNEPALATYKSAGARPTPPSVIREWQFAPAP